MLMKLIHLLENNKSELDLLDKKVLKELLRMRHKCRLDAGMGGQCGFVAEWAAQEFGWEYVWGAYLDLDGNPIGDHSWNYMPDGTLVDATADQFGEGYSIRVLKSSDPDYKRYRWPEYAADYHPHHPDYHGEPVEFDGEFDSEKSDRLRKERGNNWWLKDTTDLKKYKTRMKKKYGDIYESVQPVALWHGGRSLEFDYQTMLPSKNKRWEHGPGLYLTTHADTARKYAKGGGKLYKVFLTKGANIEDVKVSIKNAVDFVNRYVITRHRKSIIKDLEYHQERVGYLTPNILLNLCINYEALNNANILELRKWIVEQGADYAIIKHFGGRDETVVVVFNPKVIKNVEIVPSSKLPEPNLNIKGL